MFKQFVPVQSIAALFLATLAFPTFATSPVDEVLCSSSGSDSDGDGWGWENNQSCRVVAVQNECLDFGSYPWGWNPTTQASCRLGESEAGECIDSDGDGWGWDGVTSCRAETEVIVTDCIDTAPVGDGWGWDGVASCVIETEVVAGACIDSEPVGDGWGWDGVTSCRIGDDATTGEIDASQVDSCEFGSEQTPGTLAYAIANSDSLIFINCDEKITVPEIVVTSGLSIFGGHFDGGGQNRVFSVRPGASLSLANSKVSGGYAERGAGILNEGEMNLSSVDIIDNKISDQPGRLILSNHVYGAAVYNAGEFTGTGVRVIGNSIEQKSGARGAGIYNLGNIDVRALSVANNMLTGEAGAGIYNAGNIELTESNVEYNLATGVESDSLPVVAVGGGGIYNAEMGTLGFYKVTISNNNTDGNGGGLLNKGQADLVTSFFNDNKAAGINNLDLNKGGGVHNSGTFNLSTGEISRNISLDVGGGIFNSGESMLNGVSIADNSAELAGGGIVNTGNMQTDAVSLLRNNAEFGGAAQNTGSLSLTSVRIEDNTAERYAAISCSGSDASVIVSGVVVNNISADTDAVEACN